MYLRGTHQPAGRRLRLALQPQLGAGNFFWHAVRTAGDLCRPALYHQGAAAEIATYSLRDLRDQVLRCTRWYEARGITPGARVGVYTKDGLLGLIHHIAITSLGGATVLANARMTPALAAAYFRRTDTTAIVGDPRLVATSLDAWDGASGAAARPAVTGDAAAVAMDGPAATRQWASYRHRPDDLIMISHSSGTTGVPKPASFTHRGFFIGKRERLWNFPSLRTDRMLSALPHSHSSGISYLSLALMIGLPTLMTDDASGAAVARAMNAFRPTIVIGFPLTLAELPVQALSADATAAVHTWMGMGDASHERHIRPLVAIGAGSPRRKNGPPTGSVYLDGLGSSEMGMVLFRVAHTATSSAYGRLIGRPVTVVSKAAALDDMGRELPAGQAGLLGVQTPSVTPGYVNDPSLTSEARRGGYFLTGDVVRQDADGNFYHLDRTPDVITTAAGKVYSLPAEEVVLLTTEALDAGVVAVDDPQRPGMSRPAGVVLFRDASLPPAADTLARCNEALAAWGLPPLAALIVTADRSDLPVGLTGKVLKRVLRERHRFLLSQPPSDGVALDSAAAADGRRA
jgi:long-chain acyl-CoA synthetase